MDKNTDRIIHLEKRIAELERKLQTTQKANLALEAAGFDIWENNFVTGEATNSNKHLFINLGYTLEERPETLDELFSYVHPEDLKKAMIQVEAHFAGKTERYRAEFRMKAKDGSWVWVGNYGQVKERNEAGEVTQFIGVNFDIDQRRMMEEAMKTMAFTDSLTGLGNRRMLFESGDLEMERSNRYDHSFSLIIADIDCFKKINDQYGHDIGDQVLAAYAQCMIEVFRQVDMKIRYGGDEFIIIMPETNLDEAYESAKRFQIAVSVLETAVTEGLTTSLGVAEKEDKESLESLIKKADNALYKAKDLGRNTVVKAN